MQTPDSAKSFLLARLLEQAARDGQPLTDIEKRMFLFSETSQTPPDFEASAKFDEECDEKAYETKISRLLKRAYSQSAKVAGERQLWTESLAALKNEDFYGLVMVDKARIPRPKTGMWTAVWHLTPTAATLVAIVALGAVLVFQPTLFHLYIPDWLRWLLFALFLVILWQAAGRLLQRAASRK